MDKRKATAAEVTDAPTLAISLPKSAHASDPISWGTTPEIYSSAGLKKVAIDKHARTDEFEKRLMGIWWATGEAPVPFFFKTRDGTLRSLDAGCVGFLLNRWRPEIEAIEAADMIVAVIPKGDLLTRYAPIKERLIALVTGQK
ncbi:hypothetical protein GGR44_002522 [Sphingobium fontiphilum]|uniref:Uncharacterized protein n=1 Tax=Sphingobium fontiphilum TaxID=944425 RepID=A0A7W6DLK1_9SPHN|nr:hypothetical protein [Sphingobium fontiphilum]MBB3982842.1 hypothetical protein [Sphingobium fontiphilum]